MGFLKSLFGDARTLSIEKIATNIANHIGSNVYMAIFSTSQA